MFTVPLLITLAGFEQCADGRRRDELVSSHLFLVRRAATDRYAKILVGRDKLGRVAQMFCCSHGALSPRYRKIRTQGRASTERGVYTDEVNDKPFEQHAQARPSDRSGCIP